MKYYLAIDLGATSGRHVVGYEKDGEVILDEIHRFKTGMDESSDGLVWNIPRFFEEIKEGIKKAFKKYPKIESLSIDTWGVDYVLMNNDKEIPPFYAYRNARNELAANRLHKIVPFEELYSYTGIQFAAFNTIYQLFDDLEKGRLENATDYLMLPQYFSYKLTGKKSHEYTEESTGAFLNAKTGEYDLNLLKKVGLPTKLFGEVKKPGFILGDLLPEIAEEVGGQTKVVLCASHDTGSAFEAVDCPEDGIIISSGTWSLFGVKSKTPICTEKSLNANFTNEGGVDYIRFLKNIMGMWIVNQVSDQENISFLEMQTKLDDNKYEEVFDVNDSSLVAPKNMKQAILKLLEKNPPKDDFDLYNSMYHSLAESYNRACKELEGITGKTYNYIYIVGGGAKNKYLDRLVEIHTGKKVVALPIEATSLGNIKVQRNAMEKIMKKVVLLGDSIRLLGYGTVIKDYLPSDVEIFQPEDNCRFAKYTLRLLFELQNDIEGADVIHFNAGLWDTCTLFGDSIPFSPVKEYIKVVSRIADILLRYGKKVIFSTTTPIRIGQPHNTNERIELYNKKVCKMLKNKGIIINDLYSVIAKDINKYIREDDCIHLTEEGIKVAATSVSEAIKKCL